MDYFCLLDQAFTTMKYRISQQNPTSQFIQISLSLSCLAGENIALQLPAWRSGRYEIANFAQYIRRLEVFANERKVPCGKITKDLWTFSAKEETDYEVQYEFFAGQMDAGGSWSDPYQLYLNFINFAFEVKNREKEKIVVVLDIPDYYRVATALPAQKHLEFLAQDFQHLVDSPLIASPDLNHLTYQVNDTTFHLWIQGEIVFQTDQLLHSFESFTKRQIEAFNDFPAKDYHFLFQLLPYTHYHGVEHRYSTVITFGPASSLLDQEKLDNLVGVSSHELYHFWNVCRIRPKELLPYDFSKETYFNSGIVAEGVTTYFGDIYLLRSGYYTLERYLTKLQKMINREFESFGWKNQAIAASSMDLWLDGYKVGIPEKKVSIYNRGALIGLCLDLILIGKGSSLEAAMRKMWVKFGELNQGYTLEDFESIIGKLVNETTWIRNFFDSYILGVSDILPILIEQLGLLGIRLESSPRENELESNYGLMLDSEKKVTKIHPEAPAYGLLMIGDIVTNVSADEEGITCQIDRHGKISQIIVPKSSSSYYKHYTLWIDQAHNRQRDVWMK